MSGYFGLPAKGADFCAILAEYFSKSAEYFSKLAEYLGILGGEGKKVGK
jgi:hypothetical protein